MIEGGYATATDRDADQYLQGILALPVLPIKPPLRGNDKIGPVLTESRETGPSCPASCPLKGLAPGEHDPLPIGERTMRGSCYSFKLGRRRTSVQTGMAERDLARSRDRSAWVRSRVKAWTKENGRPVRFLVHGDMVDPRRPNYLDTAWIVDVLRAARQVKGFRGWGYTHTWRYPGAARVRDLFRKVGITLWASVHTVEENSAARAAGWNTATISETPKAGYTGARVYRTVPGPHADRPAIVCPEQLGSKADCLSCGFCYQSAPKCDLILLKH